MIRQRYVLAAIAGPLIAQPALAELEHTCTLGATVRTVEVRYAGDRGRPPCEVVYRKETERPGREEVLWSATRDVGFCEAKVDELTRLLESNGWTCSPDDPLSAAAAGPPDPPPDDSLAIEEAGPSMSADDVRPADRPVLLPPPRRPATVEAAAEGPRDEPAEGAGTPEPLAEAGPADQPVRDLEQAEDAGEEAGVGGVFIPAEALEAAVERDLARLKKSADDAVEATVGSFGDLNDDQIDDAAVLITFDAEGNDHAQYLVAYVAEGGTYRPAASRFIGGRYRKIFGANVRAIQDGRIELDLQVLEPDDLFCCPSGSETAEFVLENGELVSLP